MALSLASLPVYRSVAMVLSRTQCALSKINIISRPFLEGSPDRLYPRQGEPPGPGSSYTPCVQTTGCRHLPVQASVPMPRRPRQTQTRQGPGRSRQVGKKIRAEIKKAETSTEGHLQTREEEFSDIRKYFTDLYGGPEPSAQETLQTPVELTFDERDQPGHP